MVPVWQFGLVGVLAVATVTDLRSRKIYNWLTFPAMAAGLILNGIMSGWAGIQSSLIGFLVGAFVFAVGFFLNSANMGAGDVKLMAAIGLWLGFPATVAAVLYVTVIGGILAFATVLIFGKPLKMAKNLYWWMAGLIMPGGKAAIDPGDSAGPPLPYGVSIALGTLLALFYPEPNDLFKLFRGG